MVQQPFKGKLSKYFLVGDNEASEMPNDEVGWKLGLSEKFFETVQYRNQLHEGEGDNMRLLSAFIAKSG